MLNKKVLLALASICFWQISATGIAQAATCGQDTGPVSASADVCVGDCPAKEGKLCWPVNTTDSWTQLPFCGGDSSCVSHDGVDAVDVGGGTQTIYAPVAGAYTYGYSENNGTYNNGNKGCSASVSFKFENRTYSLRFVHMPYSNGAAADNSNDEGICKTGSVYLNIGDEVGVTNSTGNSSGTHLHLQVDGQRTIGTSVLAQVFFNGITPLNSNKEALTNAVKDNLCSKDDGGDDGGDDDSCLESSLVFDPNNTWEACVNNQVPNPTLGLSNMKTPIVGLKNPTWNFGYNGGKREGRCHVGLDLYPTSKNGTDNVIQAMTDGTIIKKTSGWGTYDTCGVDILHTAKDGTQYVFRYGEYANCNETTYSNLSVGQTVRAGTPLGILQTSSHLHMEMHLYANQSRYFGSGWETISCTRGMGWCASHPRDTIMCSTEAPATAEFLRNPKKVIQETL
ncbi:MAG: hypothetical protein Q4G02_02405 [bacterium]|nr:hypothetical protein [bacterium]